METAFIKNLIIQLNKQDIKYVLTGGFTLAYYGFPRASMDIDIIVEKNKTKLLNLARILQKHNYSVKDEDILYAIEKCEHFAVFYKDKLPYFDFKIACDKDSLFALTNYTHVTYHGVKCRVVKPEALIVKKIEWGDLKDVRSILARYKKKIDMKILTEMAKTKNVHEILQKLIEETEL